MTKIATGFICSLVLLMLCMQGVMAAVQPILYFEPGVVESNTGDDDHVLLLMDGVNRGLSGYGVIISIDDPHIAQITSLEFPEWVGLQNTKQINRSSYLIQGSDVTYEMDPGSTQVPLLDIHIHATAPGYADITATPVVIDDDQKGRYEAGTATGSIVITGAGPIPIIPMSR